MIEAMNRKGLATIVVLLAIAAVVLVVGGIWYYRAHRPAAAYTSQIPQMASSTQAIAAKATCTGRSSMDFSNLYTIGVTYTDQNGNKTVIPDECSPSGDQIQAHCYENPAGSGNYSVEKTTFDCPLGCAAGACRSAISSQFSFPYPVVWHDGEMVFSPQQYEFSLTGVSLGTISAPAGLVKDDGSPYATGTPLFALTLSLKIMNTQGIPPSFDVPMNLRLLLDEEGDMALPNTRSFSFHGTNSASLPLNSTAYDQEVIFVVPETQKQFTLTTGGYSDVFFSVEAQPDGTINVTGEPTSG